MYRTEVVGGPQPPALPYMWAHASRVFFGHRGIYNAQEIELAWWVKTKKFNTMDEIYCRTNAWELALAAEDSVARTEFLACKNFESGSMRYCCTTPALQFLVRSKRLTLSRDVCTMVFHLYRYVEAYSTSPTSKVRKFVWLQNWASHEKWMFDACMDCRSREEWMILVQKMYLVLSWDKQSASALPSHSDNKEDEESTPKKKKAKASGRVPSFYDNQEGNPPVGEIDTSGKTGDGKAAGDYKNDANAVQQDSDIVNVCQGPK